MTHPSKVKGDRFERTTAEFLRAADVIVSRIPAGASSDRGDLWIPGHTVQCKNAGKPSLGVWWAETKAQQANNGDRFGWLIHSRRGVANPAEQWVTMDVAQFAVVLHGLSHPNK